MPCLPTTQQNTIDLELLDVGVDFQGDHRKVAFDSITVDLPHDIHSVLHSYQHCDGTVCPGHCKSTSVFMHDLPIVSCHDRQEKNMISQGDCQLSVVDDRHSKPSHECRMQ